MFENWILKFSTPEWEEQRATLDLTTRQSRSVETCNRLTTEHKFDFNVDCEELKKSGVMIIDNVLDQDQSRNMYEYFLTKPCYDFYGRHQKFDLANIPKNVKLGRHTIKDNLLCPNIIELITNEKLTKVASSYLGCPATLSLVLPMWSFPQDVSEPINMQLFHRDADDYKFVKFFVLLSDVELGEGEQVYVKRSHIEDNLPKDMLEIVRYSDEQVFKYFSHELAKTISGESGTSWFADTYGIHRGTVPRTKPRLILQLQYSYNPVPIFNYKSYRYSKWNELSELVKYTSRLYLRE